MLDWPGSIFDRVISIFVTYLGQLWPNFSALVDGSETTPLMISAFIISAPTVTLVSRWLGVGFLESAPGG